MKERTSALYSKYVIDGIRMDVTPGQMLDSACGQTPAQDEFEPIVDERVDPDPAPDTYDSNRIGEYLEKTAEPVARKVPAAYADSFTRGCIARSLIDVIWREGHFRLDDLQVHAAWKWNGEPVGSMAAFYASAEAACDYLDGLGLPLAGYSYSESRSNSVSLRCMLSNASEERAMEEDEPIFNELPFRTLRPRFGTRRKCPATLSGSEDTWLIYIPFDSCSFRLGGSLLSEALGTPGGKAPDIMEPDYFIDCYEVVRELVEDGIALSGATVGDGGLMTALGRLCGEMGIAADLSGIMKAYGENDMTRVLFAEVPGVLIEIRDYDFDYLDAELLLQDVAYYPLGRPLRNGGKITVSDTDTISDILSSLMSEGAIEGED